MLPRTLTLTLAAATLAACSTERSSPSAQTVEVIGDTTIVRSQGPGMWGTTATLVPEVSIGELEGPDEYLFGTVGSIAVNDDRTVYVLDTQAQHIRVFDSTGTYIKTLGRRGEGPGELSHAEAIALLPDGRLVVRDPDNMRVQLYGPGPGETDEWGYRASTDYTDEPMYTDARGRTLLVTRDQSRTDFVWQLVFLGPDGTPLDTMPQPSSDFEPPTLKAEYTTGNSSSSTSTPVPFSPTFAWALHPSGHFLTGLSTEYRIELERDDGVLRIERDDDPVPVSDDERRYLRDMITQSMRNTQPDWSWDGPPIPDDKPPFLQLHPGRDGRIWVLPWPEAHILEGDEQGPAGAPAGPMMNLVWTSYDVFEEDGTYLGTVQVPEGFSAIPIPVFDGNHVWAVSRDELGVERVVRYRIEVEGRDIVAAQEALTDVVMALDGVVGTAVGECGGQDCIKVYLAAASEALEGEIPGVFGGFPVVTEVTGEIRGR